MAKIFASRKKVKEASPELLQWLREAGDFDYLKAYPAQMRIAKALTTPLREGILNGDIVSGIFEEQFFAPGTTVKYPKSFLTPDNTGDFIAYTLPAFGYIPQRQVVGDEVMVPTYPIGNAIDAPLRYLRDANWPVQAKMQEVLLAGHVRKKNDDGFHVLLAAAAGRNVVVVDSSAATGLFTKRLVALADAKMKRLGGGNSTSSNLRRLTDIYMSIEGVLDMRSWDLTQVDDVTRREIYVADEGGSVFSRIFGINIHGLYEFGVGMPYQNYLANTLGASLNGKEEFALGLDLTNNDSFVHPVRERLGVFPDPVLHREQKVGWYSWEEIGYASLSNQNALLLAF